MKLEGIESIILNNLNFLKNKLKFGQYSIRSFYGELFTALAMAEYNKELYKEEIKKILECYFMKEKKIDSEFHWEFNNYALLKLKEKGLLGKYEKEIKSLKFKGTMSSNWILLRGLSRIISKEKSFFGYLEIFKVVIFYQKKSGFIKDSSYVNSFQYHSFMTFLLYDIYIYTKSKYILKKFLKAIDFIEKFILRNGDSNYVGRGQRQIFGIGPLLFSLEKAYEFTGDIKYKKNQIKVFKFLKKFMKEDGTFPLVLRSGEENYPQKINVNDKNYIGWYGYNNYFDYSAFLVYFLCMLKNNNINESISKNKNDIIENKFEYRDSSFFIFKNKLYDAVLSKPGGSMTNSIPIPYLITIENDSTSIYGGEEYGSDLYSFDSIPLPLVQLNEPKGMFLNNLYSLIISEVSMKKYWLKKLLKNKKERYINFSENLNYSFDNNRLMGKNYYFKHIRSFVFKENKIVISDKIIRRNKDKKINIKNRLCFNKIEKENNKNVFSINKNIKIKFYKDYKYQLEKRKFFNCIGTLDSLIFENKIVSDIEFYQYELIIKRRKNDK